MTEQAENKKPLWPKLKSMSWLFSIVRYQKQHTIAVKER